MRPKLKRAQIFALVLNDMLPVFGVPDNPTVKIYETTKKMSTIFRSSIGLKLPFLISKFKNIESVGSRLLK